MKTCESPEPKTGPRRASIMVGVVLRRRPGVTRWAKWVWEPAGLIPGAAPADWKVLREEDGAIEYHAVTLPLELHRAETESYRVTLAMNVPSAFVVMRDGEGSGPDGMGVLTLTVSAYEAQDYLDTSEDIVEPVRLPDALVDWLASFCAAQGEETPFKKRRRDKKRVDLKEDGVGDARIRQDADVYRSPSAMKPGRLH
ncbi:DUF3305 domain-containing protein [Marimonas arenosa]|uniref:DUF3305 domain-containing protein n=1 Tax=Marimonas arenosa TaxID=1795305 RepID=A0AAE3WIC2_9RHOB|nr:DUF3305 domain-containing protein [Marimonas arenosa]MDQ2092185.1 DUF3305 domain-containing protein [Marimonas arenosa]